MILKPKVIVISGSVGSGKSTISSKLSELLNGSPVLRFDDYEEFIEWPPDMVQWIRDGCDPNEIKIPRLKNDLVSLVEGEEIVYSKDDQMIKADDFILLEEPSGREREEISALIDHVIFLDVPRDVCVYRMIQRAIDMDVWHLEGTFENEPKSEIVKQLDAVATWINQYKGARQMYMTVNETVKNNADVVVNGLMPVDEIAMNILDELGIRTM